ncbi:hypothetical protein BBJ28_00011661 [Nothophytophthora sp. Chile5]|nr:hypothetical protein BBJ28_00011661 [Nothophytophthora sp. Chile5]
MFTLFISSMFCFKYLLEVCIEDVPEDVQAQKYRQEFLISKCLYHMPDDDVNSAVFGEEDVDNPENALTIDDEDA